MSSLSRCIEVISRTPVFAPLNPRELSALAARVIQREFQAGEILFYEGEPCKGLYILAEGRVKLTRTSSSGRELTLAVECAPSSIAEIPVFDGGPYPATAVALEPTKTYFIAAKDMQELCRQYPEIAIKILGTVGRRLRALILLLHRLTFGSVRRRLALLLLELAESNGSHRFALPYTHEEIAAQLGTVREVVTRNLSRFQAQALIHVHRREIEILDAAGLRHEAELEE